MKIKKTILLLLSVLALSSCQQESIDENPSEVASADVPSTLESKALENKEKARQYLETGFIQFDADKAMHFLGEPYTQHNPTIPDGLEPVRGFINFLKSSDIEFYPSLYIADEQYVVIHSMLKNVPLPGLDNIVAIDVVRFENGLIVEHWDNLEPLQAEPNLSGRTQIVENFEITDVDKTDVNKKLVQEYLETVLIGEDMTDIANYMAVDFAQHSVGMTDGIDGMVSAFNSAAATGKGRTYEKVHMLVGEGNFVFAMIEGKIGEAPVAFYDIFRVDGGKIVEHWDIVQAIPPLSESQNDNGKF